MRIQLKYYFSVDFYFSSRIKARTTDSFDNEFIDVFMISSYIATG